MHRLTAKLLLLFAIVGNLIPLALAVTAPPLHSCCMRKAHRCHEQAAAEAGQPVFRDPCSCNNHSRHAATTPQWAHPKTQIAEISGSAVERLDRKIESTLPSVQPASLHASRAPPSFSIA